jgi:nitrogen fixation NifU-like protein
MTTQKLYHDQLLDHYKHPQNKGKFDCPDCVTTIFNPLCGDEVTLQAMVKDGVVTDCKFEGKGCVISLAAASMLTDLVIGKSINSVLKLDKDTMLGLVKLELGPTRLRCALLALEALQKGLNDVAPGKAA